MGVKSSGRTVRPTSSIVSRTAASTGDSPGSSLPPGATMVPIPKPFFFRPRSTSSDPASPRMK